MDEYISFWILHAFVSPTTASQPARVRIIVLITDAGVSCGQTDIIRGASHCTISARLVIGSCVGPSAVRRPGDWPCTRVQRFWHAPVAHNCLTRESERIYIIARSTVTRSSRLSSTSALLMFRTVRPILPEVSEGNHFQKLALSTGHCKQYSGNSAWRHTHRRKHTRWQSLLETVWFVCSSRRGRVTALHCRDVCKCFMV